MTGPQQQHDDPVGETRSQLVQALAVAATVGEAAARWAAVGVQNRASKREQADRAEQASAAARAHADQLAHQAELEQDRADRQHIARAFDDEWLNHADLTETARLWRTATLRAAGGDQWAREAMSRAEERLQQLRPNLMDFYDRFRGEGRSPAEAMRAAAYGVWLRADNTNLGPRARPQPGRQPAGLRAGAHGRALDPGGAMLDDLDAAVRREVADLAAGVDPEALDRLQRQWRSAGLVPAADAAGLLAQYAHQLHAEGQVLAAAADRLEAAARRAATGEAADAAHLAGYAAQERGQATKAAGTPDLTATVVDEHRDGLVRSSVSHGDADHDAVRAGQQRRMAQTFPHLTVVQATQPHLAGKQPAQTVPTRQRGRAR